MVCLGSDTTTFTSVQHTTIVYISHNLNDDFLSVVVIYWSFVRGVLWPQDHHHSKNDTLWHPMIRVEDFTEQHKDLYLDIRTNLLGNGVDFMSRLNIRSRVLLTTKNSNFWESRTTCITYSDVRLGVPLD